MKTQNLLPSALALGLGLLAARVAAPALHSHGDAALRYRTMWAHEYGSLDQMVVDADAVVLATVHGTALSRVVETAAGPDHPLPFTLVDLHVDHVFRGDVEDDIVVEQTGGELGPRTYFVEGEGGPYAEGEQVLLFLKRQAQSDMYYVSNPKGRFRVVDGALRAIRPDDPVAALLDGREALAAGQMLRRVGKR